MIDLDEIFGAKNKIDINERFDKKFNVWQPYLDIHTDGTFSYGWQVIGVAETYTAAQHIATNAEKKAKHNAKSSTL